MSIKEHFTETARWAICTTHAALVGFDIAFLVSILFGCSPKTITETVVQERNDSVRIIETKYERVVVRDTAFIEIPMQTTSVTLFDSVSTLENDYAVSVARIASNGSLFHELRTKAGTMPVPVDKTIERKDSVTYIYKDREVQVPTPVETPLTWWQRTSIKFFPYVVALAILACVWACRKPLLTLIRRFI